MVIGKDPQAQLAPYDENIEVPDYRTGEVSEEEKKSMLDYFFKKGFEGTFEQCYEKYGEDWNSGQFIRDPEDGIWYEHSTYNPKSQWDWYSLGGRWRGFFKLKDGVEEMTSKVGEAGVFDNKAKHDADQAYKKDIDFDGMIDHCGKEALEKYEKLEKHFDGAIPRLKYTWGEVLDGKPFTDKDIEIDVKRDFYHSQPAMKKLDEVRKNLGDDHPDRTMFVWLDMSDYNCTKEEYVERARNNAISTYAIVKDGEWIATGEMGWFGMSNDKISQDDWDKKFWTMIEELPDDTLLSLYDCHI